MDNTFTLNHLARLGAISRLKELEEEAAAIRRMFPGLRKPTGAEAPAESVPKPATRKRPKMSAANREAARERMKAYWAKRKGEERSQASDGPRRTTKRTRARRAQ